MAIPLRVLIVEDSKDDTDLLMDELRQGDFEPTWERVETAGAMEEALNKGDWDLVLSDYRMPRFDGLQAFKLLQERGIDLPFIIVSGVIGEETAIKALQEGVHDYLLKDNLMRLNSAIERGLRESRLRKEHRKLEKQLLQSRRLESIGLLAGGVAHEFNNLLTGMIGYSNLLLKRWRSDESTAADLRQILNLADRGVRLTRQLLSFSRQQPVNPTVVHLNDLIENILSILERLIGEDIELNNESKADPDRIRADFSQIEQVLMNLAINARDALPGGGTLTIETANTTLSDEFADIHPEIQPGRYVVLTVSDNGEGMDETTLENIFEPFFTTKAPGKGTGLGLSTVYGIVREHDGHIEVESAPGEGACFKIYLPAAAATVGPPPDKGRVGSSKERAKPFWSSMMMTASPRL